MVSTAGTALGLFLGTNIDGLLVAIVLFVAVRQGALRTADAVLGQYLGIAVLVGLSATAAAGLAAVPASSVRFLGLIPLLLGVRGLALCLRHRDDRVLTPRSPIRVGGMAGVIAMTLGSGGDNIAVYTPWFRQQPISSSIETVAVFAVALGPLLIVGWAIGSHPSVERALEKVGHWLVPLVYVALGLIIILWQ